MKIAVLGAGMVGRAIAADLAQHHDVCSFDKSSEALERLLQRTGQVSTTVADLMDYPAYGKFLEGYDLVVSAVPGFMGYRTLEAVIAAGKNVADISFFPEDALQLDLLAKQQNVTAITDCGVAPGMGNFILGRYNEIMQVESFSCFVGGLPRVRKKPFEYKAPFSPVDVIEEYTRPSRQKENGHIVVKPALSERQFLDFEEIGTLEAFNTDGLRSILYTMPHIPNLKEQTLRYPGHVDLILALQMSGFFDEEPLEVKGAMVSPRDFCSEILFKEWKLGEEEEEFTIMRVRLEGVQEGKPLAIEYNLLDRYDPETKTASMSRTTGYTCAASAELILQGHFREKGVFPPELVGKNAQCFEFLLQYLAERGVHWKMR